MSRYLPNLASSKICLEDLPNNSEICLLNQNGTLVIVGPQGTIVLDGSTGP